MYTPNTTPTRSPLPSNNSPGILVDPNNDDYLDGWFDDRDFSGISAQSRALHTDSGQTNHNTNQNLNRHNTYAAVNTSSGPGYHELYFERPVGTGPGEYIRSQSDATLRTYGNRAETPNSIYSGVQSTLPPRYLDETYEDETLHHSILPPEKLPKDINDIELQNTLAHQKALKEAVQYSKRFLTLTIIIMTVITVLVALWALCLQNVVISETQISSITFTNEYLTVLGKLTLSNPNFQRILIQNSTVHLGVGSDESVVHWLAWSNNSLNHPLEGRNDNFQIPYNISILCDSFNSQKVCDEKWMALLRTGNYIVDLNINITSQIFLTQRISSMISQHEVGVG